MEIHEYGSYFQHHDILAHSGGKCLRITQQPRGNAAKYYIYVQVDRSWVNNDTDSDNYKQDWIYLSGCTHVTDQYGKFLLSASVDMSSDSIKEVIEITQDEFKSVDDCVRTLREQINRSKERMLKKYRYDPKVTDSATA